MAYNPFNIFRRNQKALFAVLTVFIMIMFTLSFGANDFFERASKWIGGRGKGEAVCKIDGDTIKDSELTKVRRARVMANMYMSLAAEETIRDVKTYAEQLQSRLSEDGKQMVGTMRMAEFVYLSGRQFLNDPQGQQYIFRAEQDIASVLENPNAKSEDKDAARAYKTLLELRAHKSQSEGGHFFVNAPNKTNRDTIEFLLWVKKADQLGIRFNREDVVRLLNREFYDQFKRDVDVRKEMQQREGFNMESFWDALAVEFKVRAAQAAVLGAAGKIANSAPVFGTPYEMFEYYRRQCSPAEYQLIAVPALAFTDKVVGEPTEEELKDLFKNYQDSEPDPSKETFGFKEPRKLAISWLAITGEEPYYQKLAAEQVKVGEVMAKGSGLLTVPLPGAGGGWALAAAAPLTLKEPAVDAAYSEYKSDFNKRLNGPFLGAYERSTVVTSDLLATSVVRPGTMTALLGGMAGQSTPFGHPAVAASIAMGAPIAYEIRDRIKAGLPLVLGGAPGPALLQTAIGGAASYKLAEPKPLSIEAKRPELIKETIKKRATALAFGGEGNRIDPTGPSEKGDIAKFIEEMEKLSEKGKPKDKAAIEKYVKEFLAARGLTKKGEQFDSSTAPRDEWTLGEDPGLRPLLFAQIDSLARAAGAHGSNRYVPFGRSFFWGPSSGARRPPTTGTYVAHPYLPEDAVLSRAEGRPHYVYWVTEDVASKKTNPTTARETVRAAWKQMKARQLAQARANELAEAIRNSPGDSPTIVEQVVRDEAARFHAQITDQKTRLRPSTFPLKNVSPLVPIDVNSLSIQERLQMIREGFDPTGRLQQYGMSESENIPYPTADMVSALLDNRDKPTKTVVVLTDAPKDTYYVATLVRSSTDSFTQKTPDDFKRNVYSPRGPARDSITGLYYRETARKSRQSVVELLKKEFKYVETEEQKKKLDENAKAGGRD